MGKKRSKAKKGGGGGSTPSKKKRSQQQQQQESQAGTSGQDVEAQADDAHMQDTYDGTERPAAQSMPTTTLDDEAEPMLIDEAEIGGSTTTTAAAASPRKQSKGKSRQPPPPPVIPPPPQAAAPTSNSTSASASSTRTNTTNAKPSSAVMDTSSITAGLIGSPSLTHTSRRPLQIIDESSPDKLSKIDIRDAQRRRDISALGDSPARGGGKARRIYEEDNDGYGEQLRVATSQHVQIPSASMDMEGEGEGDVSGDLDYGGPSSKSAASLSSAAALVPRGGGAAPTTAGGGKSSRAEAAARLQALRGFGGNGGAESTRPTQSRSKTGNSRVQPAPPAVAPPPPPPQSAAAPPPQSMLSPAGSAVSATDSMAAKIQSLNDNKGKTTTAAQQRAAELASLRRKGIAKIFNRHFTAEAATIAKEKEAADRALAELERQKLELAQKHRAYKDRDKDRGAGGSGDASELNQIDAMAAEIRRRRVEVRQKEQETKELYRRYVCQFGGDASTATSASASASGHQKDKARSTTASTNSSSAQAANNAAAEFFRSVNTGANAGLPLLGPGRISSAPAAGAKSSAAAAGNRRLSFESDHSYQGEVGGAVVTPTASSAPNRSFGIGDNLYQGQMGGTVIAPGQKQRYRSSAKRVLPSVGEETEDMDIDLQSENVVRQADLLMAKMMEKQDTIEQAEVQPKRSKIDAAVTELKKEGKEAAVPVGRDQITVGLQRHGSRHAVSGVGTDGEDIVVSRSGGVLNKNYDGMADVKDSEVNYATYRERNLVPMDPSQMVDEFTKPVEGLEPINTPAGVVWKRPEGLGVVGKDGVASNDATNAAPSAPFGTRLEDITPLAGHVSDIIGSFDASLRSTLNIDPTKDSFTVKIVGNPSDATTAEHIKSLIQTFRDQVVFVSISDGSVCVEDTSGLDHQELLRLVKESSSVSKYDESKLSESGAIRRVASDGGSGGDTSETISSNIKADVFFSYGSSVPLGVAAITGEDGNVTAKLVVQASCTSITDDAREALQKAGVGIVQNRQDIAKPLQPLPKSTILSSLDSGLREVARIDISSEAFTIKIAGGPADVLAADEIRTIISTYGDNAKIVAITDASGCAEDLNGLDHAELLHLIDNKSSIAAYDASKVSGRTATVHSSDTAEGKAAGETMFSRVEADAFLPLSGPGSMIDAQTYKTLLREYGKASTKVIIEGTNARITAEARQLLDEEADIAVQRQATPLVATLDEQLRATLEVDPTKTVFSVKLTGGPADESTAQEIRILIREYGDKVKFVAIADDSGCVEDASGIDHQELLRLVQEGKPMSHYNEKKLSDEGKLHLSSTADGIKARNSMPYRVKSDVYIPAGFFSGSSIDVNNYRSFVQEDGSPSSVIIVEASGASSYVSADARARLLEEAGVKVFSPAAVSPVEISRSAPLLAGSPISSRVVDADLGVDKDMKTPGRSLLVSSPGDHDVSMMPLADDQGLPSPLIIDEPIEDSPYKHLDFSVNSDSVSSLGSLGDMTQDDITVATTTLFNFLRQETENIRKMFEESERAEREALEGGGSGDNASIHTRQSAMSKESEEIRRATQQAELMAKSMAQATSWIDGGGEDDGEGDETNAEEDESSPGRLYSIHQSGDMLEFGIDSTIKSVRWDCYWSTEHSREYYHEPRTNTTTWTRPPGMRVDSQSPSRNPSAAPTENTSLFSDDLVEVRDFTNTGELAGGSITPSSVCQSTRSPGASILSDVTYDGDKVTPRSRAGNSWFWSPSSGRKSSSSIAPSADEFRPDSGAASNSLAQYRLKQKRRRRRRRKRAAVAVALLLLVTAVVFLFKGTELVPIINEMSGGRVARAVLPFIDESTAIEYGLAKPAVKAATKPLVKQKKKKNNVATSEKTSVPSSISVPGTDAHKEKPKGSDAVDISRKPDTKQREMNPKNAERTAAALNAETEKMMRRRRAICNIPMMYLFYRPCWRESRSLPLDMSFLDSTMQ